MSASIIILSELIKMFTWEPTFLMGFLPIQLYFPMNLSSY